MAAHLKSLGLPPGARIALLTKNCAHFFIAELAIWMAGGTTVAIFPTETAATVRYVLEHSEASLLFVGKLDAWAQQAAGVPAGLPCIALPLAPPAAELPGVPRWEDIALRTAPLVGRPRRAADDLAMLVYTSGSTGEPKGVMHSFGRITRTVECMLADPERNLPVGVPWRTVSYLPLAHIYERAVVECRSLMAGNVQRVLQRIAGHVHRRREARAAHGVRLGAAAVAEAAAGGVADAAGRQARRAAGRSGHRRRHRTARARQPGPGRGAAGLLRRGTGAAVAAGLVPTTGAAPGRRLWHDRRLRLLAPHHARAQRRRPCRHRLPRRAGAHR